MAAEGPGVDAQNQKLEPLQSFDFQTQDGLSATRYWPKMGCDKHRNACQIGESGGPDQVCNETIGCAPPVDSKFEASFGMDGIDWVDVSLVDGWTLPFKFILDGECSAGDGNRTVAGVSDCSKLSLSHCPVEEAIGDKLHSLQVVRPGSNKVVGCYSPCSKLTLSQWENEESKNTSPSDPKASRYCCPTPPETPEACRSGPVEKTGFVQAVHEHCPGVYGYSYDDGMGLITCPKSTRYEMIFYCPDISVQAHADAPSKQKPHHGKHPSHKSTKSKTNHARHQKSVQNVSALGVSEGEGQNSSTSSRSEAKGAHNASGQTIHSATSNATRNATGRAANLSEIATGGKGVQHDSAHAAGAAGKQCLDDAVVLVGNQYCGHLPLYSGISMGFEDCRQRCKTDLLCNFYAHWETGGIHWCRLTKRCDHLKADSDTIVVCKVSAKAISSAPTTTAAEKLIMSEDSEDALDGSSSGMSSVGSAEHADTLPKGSFCCFFEESPGKCVGKAVVEGGPCGMSREACKRCLDTAIWYEGESDSSSSLNSVAVKSLKQHRRVVLRDRGAVSASAAVAVALALVAVGAASLAFRRAASQSHAGDPRRRRSAEAAPEPESAEEVLTAAKPLL